MKRELPRQVDTVIVGAGPSALILSYILHGHVPVYDLESPHPDSFLHEKLKSTIDLLGVDVDHVTEHFGASRFSYSTQALPVNVLLDTLIRPLGETDDAESKTCLTWQYDPTRSVSHVVVGDAASAGGQWVDNPVKASWDIGTLSYAGMLSLPGYSFADFYLEKYAERLPYYLRPSRRDVTDYFERYPSKVGISNSLHFDTALAGIRRRRDGFYIASHDISCRRLVLASGTYTTLLQPRPLLQPLLSLAEPMSESSKDPVLVIGSGFSAADVIISTPASRKIIHIYKWAPSASPSPLKACHQNAYPEYAGVYRKMKLAALSSSKQSKGKRPTARRTSSSAFDSSRNWADSYEGLPNTQVIDVRMHGDKADVTFRIQSGEEFSRSVGSLAYVVGRRGSLAYLDDDLRLEVCPSFDTTQGLSGGQMRDTANEDLEVAKNVFIVGSVTGDTLIRFAYGGCVYAAGRIMEDCKREQQDPDQEVECTCVTPARNGTQSGGSRFGRSGGSGSPANGYVKSMHGLDGHEIRLNGVNSNTGRERLERERKESDRREVLV